MHPTEPFTPLPARELFAVALWRRLRKCHPLFCAPAAAPESWLSVAFASRRRRAFNLPERDRVLCEITLLLHICLTKFESAFFECALAFYNFLPDSCVCTLADMGT
jgi:hypothetical protein